MRRNDVSPWASTRFTRRAAVVLVAGASVTGLLAGCGASRLAETSRITSAVQGGSATSASGDIALRDLTVRYPGEQRNSYPAGGNAPLIVRMANSGRTADVLTSVSTDDGTVVYVPGKGSPSATTKPRGTVPGSPSATASLTATPSSTAEPGSDLTSTTGPTGTASPAGTPTPTRGASHKPGKKAGASRKASASATPSSTGKKHFHVKLGAKSLVELVPGRGGHLVLTNLRHSIAPGHSVHLTFHFRQAGAVDVTVPMPGPSVVTERSKVPNVESGE